jgi:hypothetical protein
MKNFKIINATPHAIIVDNKEGFVTTYDASEFIARVSSETVLHTEFMSGLAFFTQSFGEIQGLPKEVEGTIYIVSAMVLSANKSREDLIAPLTDSSAERNQNGHIISVKGFVL